MKKIGLLYRLIALLGSFTVYLPIIAGILFIMWYLVPLWYLSWYIVLFIFPFFYWDGHWNPYNEVASTIIGIIGFLIFVLGVGLFLYSLAIMVIQKSKGDTLVNTGPYRWVRHPQHLGITLLLLAPTLWPYIRPSDILSWSLIAFGLIVTADIEEVSLSKRFEGKYEDYRSRVPFILPYNLSLPSFLKTGILGQGKPARYVLWFAIYWILMSFILFLFSFVHLDYWA